MVPAASRLIKATRWGKPHNDALNTLFAERKANPERQDTDYIGRIWRDEPVESVLHQIGEEKFRHHYRDKSPAWLTERALSGVRRSESGRSPDFCSYFLSLCQLLLANIILVLLFW